jgi:hypothetical protein
MESQKESKAVHFNSEDDHNIRTRIRRLSDRYFFPKNYDPPVWDPLNDDDFDVDETIVFYGQRRDGKSTLSRYLMLKLRRYFPLVYVFSGTAFNNYWQQVVPARHVIQVDLETKDGREASLNVPCQKLLNLSSARYSEWKAAERDHEASGNPLVLMLGDDIVTNNTMRQCPAISQLVMNGRHHGIAGWFLTQTWGGLTPNQRKNIDRFILFKATDFNVEHWVLDTYGAHVVDMYRRVTDEPFTAFVIVNKSRVSQTRFYKFKADVSWVNNMLGRNVVMGNKRAWGDVDPAEQKAEMPYVDVNAKRLKTRFQQDVGVKKEGAFEDGELHSVSTEVPEEGPPIEVFRSW